MCQDSGCELSWRNCNRCTDKYVNSGIVPASCEYCFEYGIRQQHQRLMNEVDRLLSGEEDEDR